MSKPTILIAEAKGFPDDVVQKLRRISYVVLADLDSDALSEAVHNVDVLWVRLRNFIGSDILTRANQLRLIVSPTTGLNHIDVKAAESKGVQILSLRGETEFLKEVRATAEFTIGLILTLMRHISRAKAHVCKGGWDRELFKGTELYQKTVGVVGYGRLGRLVSHYLLAFGCDVLIVDPYVSADKVDTDIQVVSMDILLRKADIITIHVNLTESNRFFFGREHFAAMKPTALLINTSRGELIDEDALCEALRDGRIAGAALDVLSNEQTADIAHRPLVQYANEYENLIITPHIGGNTEESLIKTERFLANKLYKLIADS